MGKIEGRCAVLCLCLCLACAAPAAVAQGMSDGVAYAAPPCQSIVAQAEIDGTMQQISALACLQPDGTWQIVQGDANALVLYPYYDPWYWGGFVTVVGGSFVFIDRFHHRHPMDRVHFNHASYSMGVRSGGWHGAGGWHNSSGWQGSGMHGADGGMRR